MKELKEKFFRGKGMPNLVRTFAAYIVMKPVPDLLI